MKIKWRFYYNNVTYLNWLTNTYETYEKIAESKKNDSAINILCDSILFHFPSQRARAKHGGIALFEFGEQELNLVFENL